MMMKTHWKKLHNPDYLGAWDFQPDERKVVTMDGTYMDKVINTDGKSEECVILKFKEHIKPMILNTTNSKMISRIVGSPYVEDWISHKIELFVTQVRAFGDIVDAVRVAQKVSVKEQLTPSHPKWEAAKQAIIEGRTTIDQIRKGYTLDEINEKLLNGTT